jgi:imidazolonepropionase-like amidohydrolase
LQLLCLSFYYTKRKGAWKGLIVKVRSLDGKKKDTALTEKTIEWMVDQWLEKVTPLTGHASYDDFAAAIADLRAKEEEVEVTVDQMPSLCRRRETV